jgi:hypothetical protein
MALWQEPKQPKRTRPLQRCAQQKLALELESELQRQSLRAQEPALPQALPPTPESEPKRQLLQMLEPPSPQALESRLYRRSSTQQPDVPRREGQFVLRLKHSIANRSDQQKEASPGTYSPARSLRCHWRRGFSHNPSRAL